MLDVRRKGTALGLKKSLPFLETPLLYFNTCPPQVAGGGSGGLAFELTTRFGVRRRRRRDPADLPHPTPLSR